MDRYKKCKLSIGWQEAQIKSREFSHKEKQKRIDKYNENPKLCLYCGTPIVYEKRENKFCGHICAASFNNKGIQRNKKKCKNIETKVEKCINTHYDKRHCVNCNIEITNKKYCSSKCQQEHRRKSKIDNFLTKSILWKGTKKYLIEIRGHMCEICGNKIWNDLDIPLELDHINGNSEDNRIENIRLICPNCHAQTPTYKNRNAGKGRHYRRTRYKEGKSY